MSEPQPGDFALTRIPGRVGALVRIGQWLNGDDAPVTHAWVYVGDGYVVEAMPGGAILTPLDVATSMPPVVWSTGRFDLTAGQRTAIVDEAYALIDTPYSFLDYLSMALARFHVRPEWLRDYVASTGHMICSQLVAECYLQAGVDLAPGNISGDVTPGDLWRVIR